MSHEPAPTRRERRKLYKALRKLRQSTALVDALNAKAQLQAQGGGPEGQSSSAMAALRRRSREIRGIKP